MAEKTFLTVPELMFLGPCRCIVSFDVDKRLNYVIGYHTNGNVQVSMAIGKQDYINHHYIIPVLRPISSMTNDEAGQVVMLGDVQFTMIVSRGIKDGYIHFSGRKPGSNLFHRRTHHLRQLTGPQIAYMVSRELDVMGYLDKGLAITQEEQIRLYREALKV
jgi:hypothetical protein